jgi:uncharacterized protein HemX
MILTRNFAMDAPSQPPHELGQAAQSIWDILRGVTVPLIGFVGAVLASAGGYLAANKQVAAQDRREHDHREQEAKRESTLADVQREAATTQRFQVLFESQKEHIDMLKTEIHSLREEVRDLRAALTHRLKVCEGCDKLAYLRGWGSLEPSDGGGV